MLNIDALKEQVGCNAPASETQIKICNLKLKQNNLPELPSEYSDMLKMCNGFSNEDAHIFGAEIKGNNWYKDIATFNIAYFHGCSVNWIILGEDEAFYFIYDAEQQKYYIAERDTLDEDFVAQDFTKAVEYILRIE